MNKSLLLILCCVWLMACKSIQNAEALPKPIVQEINRFSASSACKDASVKQLEFQGQAVFLFEEGTCVMDKESRVLDKNGKLLGHLGGFTGNTSILGEDFSNAQFQKELWRKSPAEPNP
ncbi:MAG: hypothetical protein JNK73_04170 [Bacteroidia bacterium]|nr:hypothetical protein [Bacteroidia bacterium]